MILNLHELRRVTEEILATTDPKKIEGAINWGDLHCVSAEHYMNDGGEDAYRVWIEEAAPDAGQLQDHVLRELHARGYDRVDVRTEW